MTVAVNNGFGRHIWELTADERATTLKAGFNSIVWAYLSPMAGRIAFCITLLYLSGTERRIRTWPIWCFIVGQLVVNVTNVIVFYTQCGTRLAVLWTPGDELKIITLCKNPNLQTHYSYFQGAFNTLTDAYLTGLPAVLIQHSKLSLKSKLGLATMLCLSILYGPCCTSTVVRSKLTNA